MNNFKKLILLLGLAVSLTACGGDTTSTSEKPKTETSQTQTETKAEESEKPAEEEKGKEEESKEEKPKEEEEPASDQKLELGKTLKVGKFDVTVQKYELAKDYEGKDALVIYYDWKNNSDEATAPYLSINFKGFQDGVETDSTPIIESVDYGIGQKDVKAGAELKDIQAAVSISDMSKPLELELDELITFTSNPYTATIDLSTLQ